MNFNLWISVSLKNQLIILESYKDNGGNINKVIPSYLYYDCPVIGDFYVSLPFVCRNRDEAGIKDLMTAFSADSNVKGIIVNNIEALYIAGEQGFSKEIIGGPGLYVWNSASKEVLLKDCTNFSYPYELSRYELKEISGDNGLLTVYGKTPLMISANCIRKTNNLCTKKKINLEDVCSVSKLRDRKNNDMSVLIHCDSCYNVIYNAIPTSLHEYVMKDVSYTNNLMLSFTDEDCDSMLKIIEFYEGLVSGKALSCPLQKFTKAYYNHGVE